MTSVLVDVDGVVSNFQKAFVATARRVLKRDFDPALINRYWDLASAMELTEEEHSRIYNEGINLPGFALSLEPMPGSLEALAELVNVADVYFVTSPVWSSHTWQWEREEWLKQHLGRHIGNKVINTSQKHMISGDILIEDRVENAARWMEWAPKRGQLEAKAMIYARPYNEKTEFQRFSDWDDVFKQVRERSHE